MKVLISAEGDHDPVGQHYMVVDNTGLLIDLSGVAGTLTDPAITKVEWGRVLFGGEAREGGVITRRDGTRQSFFERALLKPYLDAFAERLAAAKSGGEA